ncbi:STAS domain-containing protein [Ferrimonas aestuarii]|uniref:STAS domain-containing protein n=1 Tax=Ferrimonas aestuarii TaxID=2569539 RepID=A0A4U1BQK5_9GAMM|nr:STAS domain-containing protein [Ferrimonas aestuarii]TKB57297.1 STAS domain-containing protein [Ferrimonas aestuarii]
MSIPLEQSLTPTRIEAPAYFDVESVAAIKDQFDELLTQPSHKQSCAIEVDLGHTEFIDSSGIGAIIYLFKRLRRQERQLQLAKVHGQPKRILTMLKVDKAIPFVESGESA